MIMDCSQHGPQPHNSVCTRCLTPVCDECDKQQAGRLHCAHCRKSRRITTLLLATLTSSILCAVLIYTVYFNETATLTRAAENAPCNAALHYQLIRHLQRERDDTAALKVAANYLQACHEVLDIRLISLHIHKQNGQLNKAILDTEALIKADPYNKDYWIWKGQLHESLRETEQAVLNYRQALKLAPRLSKIPMNVVTLLSSAAQYCEAYIELNRYMSEFPELRTNAKINFMLDDFFQKGDCVIEKQRVAGIIKFPPGGNTIKVTSTVNHEHSANFVVDTGAAMVTVTPELARRLGLEKQGRPVQFLTANGLTTGYLAKVSTITVAGITAHDVEVAILNQPLGNNLDGLLGMSFLARFNLNLDSAAGQLTLTDKFNIPAPENASFGSS
ncbi:aspartyl protease-like protein [Oleiphilus messinensis]|uniref:Aspartyl protease-like protein n=1 Tax=Oleiphilus messinensis TaxID=141451 RepID=A0A1Y0I2W1_9GAMM|nr:retropepsin-like aspartic protease [Oleiphilus messinensis]ARU54549.1 aspartyl protease-like protein [Oleiphilus messinensis]